VLPTLFWLFGFRHKGYKYVWVIHIRQRKTDHPPAADAGKQIRHEIDHPAAGLIVTCYYNILII